VHSRQTAVDTQTLLIAHAAATWLLTGLIWVVQLVHYPLFEHVVPGQFVEFERRHATAITWIVAPAMGAELVTGVGLLLMTAAGTAHTLLLVGAGLIAVNWASTAWIQVPCHRRLSNGFDATVHRRLVRSNWIRTAAWSLRAVLVAVLLALGLGS
jgi:hypothetical protein